MKTYLAVLAVLYSMTAFGQDNIITITEKDEDGKYIKQPAKYTNRSIADINSRISVHIDKSNLLAALVKTGKVTMPAKISELLAVLKEAMEREKVVLAQFYATLKQYNPADTNRLTSEAFNNSMSQVTNYAVQMLYKYPRLEEIYEDDASGTLLASFFTAVRTYMKEMEQDFMNRGVDSLVKIQMGAWLYHNRSFMPVHINGFDELPQGEYYVLDRWSFLPSDEQLDQLKAMQDLAKENRDAGLTILKTTAANYISEFIHELRKRTEQELSDIIAEVQRLRNDIGTSPIPADLDKLLQQYGNWKLFCGQKIDYYSRLRNNEQFLLNDFFVQIGADIGELNAKASETLQTLKLMVQHIEDLTATAEARAANLKSLVMVKVKLFGEKIRSFDLSGIIAGERLNTDVLEFSNKINKMSLTDLPENAEIDLAYTGARVAGDRLVLKLGVVKGDAKETVMSTREISLYRVAPHLEGTVGVVFANPFKATAIQKEFQMAPYYNLLIKGAWPWGEQYRRRSVINNTLKEFSWGLHVSSPDFNKDDVPELAVGIVLSGLKDYLQVGVAHNIFENAAFWFFGIRLPVPAMNFGGGTTQKND